MKRIFLALLGAAFAAAARADLTMTLRIEQEGSEPQTGMTMTVKARAQKVRTDYSQVSSIVDLKTGDVISLLHPQKVVMTIPGASMRNMRKALSEVTESDAQKDAEPPRPTGRTETISGYACEEYVIGRRRAAVHVWLTSDLPHAEELAAELAVLADGANPLTGIMKSGSVPGFPLRTVILTSGSGKTTITAVAVNEDAIPDSEFVVPEGYQTMQVPTSSSR